MGGARWPPRAAGVRWAGALAGPLVGAMPVALAGTVVGPAPSAAATAAATSATRAAKLSHWPSGAGWSRPSTPTEPSRPAAAAAAAQAGHVAKVGRLTTSHGLCLDVHPRSAPRSPRRSSTAVAPQSPESGSLRTPCKTQRSVSDSGKNRRYRRGQRRRRRRPPARTVPQPDPAPGYRPTDAGPEDDVPPRVRPPRPSRHNPRHVRTQLAAVHPLRPYGPRPTAKTNGEAVVAGPEPVRRWHG